MGGDPDAVAPVLAAGAQDHLGWDELSERALARSLRYALERRRTELGLAFEVLHDPVTGLPNQALLLDHLRAGLGRSLRSRSGVAVVVLGVGGFRLVNETLGRPVPAEQLVRRTRAARSPKRVPTPAWERAPVAFCIGAASRTPPG